MSDPRNAEQALTRKRRFGWFSVAIKKLAITGPRLWFHGLVVGSIAIGIVREGPQAFKDRGPDE